MNDTPRKIIIDTDPGIDDAMAIHFAFAHPGLDLIGLTTVFGNVHTAQATRNALALVEMAGADIPVAGGASAPLVQPQHPPADFVHGKEGFGAEPAPTPLRTPDPRTGAVFLAETCAAHPGEVTIVAVGPLTNLARALDHDPSIAGTVRSVLVMGGAVEHPGNVSEVAEANIWNDPHAAERVFAADWQVTMVGLDVTMKVRCTPDDFDTIAAGSPEIGGFLNRITPFYFDYHQDRYGTRECAMHDALTLIAVTDPGLFGARIVPVRVETEGVEIGRTVIAPDARDRRDAAVAQTVDADGARAVFLDTLGRADACRRARNG